MPRRRAGRKYQIRRAHSVLSGKPSQKRGNNTTLINSLINRELQKLSVTGKPKITIVSDIIVRKTIFLIDFQSGSRFCRQLGHSTVVQRGIYIPDCETLSEASTLSHSGIEATTLAYIEDLQRPSSPGIEVITLD